MIYFVNNIFHRFHFLVIFSFFYYILVTFDTKQILYGIICYGRDFMFPFPNRLTFERVVIFMDLHSPQDKTLLKNCIVVKLQQLKLTQKEPTLENIDEISYYENLYQVLKDDDTDILLSILNDTEKYNAFNQHILLASAKDIANDYLDLTKSLLLENNVYSDENFEKLKKAFLNGNENLSSSDKTKNLNELEEEPEISTYVTKEMQELLDKLSELFKENHPKSMSGADFKNFTSRFKDLTKKLGICALQSNFDGAKQTIQDMQIFYEQPTELAPVYKVDLTLCDNTTQKLSHSTLTERANASGYISTYFQSLCYSILEAQKYSTKSEDLLDSSIITNKMNSFAECYRKLKDMTKCKLNILPNNTVAPSAMAADEPSRDLDMIQEL